MSECPVCRTRYVKGRLDRCHICGWQFEASGFSMIGPVKIEHQVSQTTLTKIQAWAHHMWTTLQEQKERIMELQGQIRQAQSPPETQPALPNPPFEAMSQLASAPSPVPTASSSPAQVWQWVLTRLEQAETERDELRSAIAQLNPQPQVLNADQLTPHAGEVYTELIKFREESQTRQYRQSEEWQEILDGFRDNIQQSLAQQARNLQTSLTAAYRQEIAALNTQVQTQQQMMAQLELRLQTLQDAPQHIVQGAIAPLSAQLEVLKTVQDNVADQLDQKLAGMRQSQALWTQQHEEHLVAAIASVTPAHQLRTLESTLEDHKHELTQLQRNCQRQFQTLQADQAQTDQTQKQFLTTQIENLQQSQDQISQRLEQKIATLETTQADRAQEQEHQLHNAIAHVTAQIETVQQSQDALRQSLEQQMLTLKQGYQKHLDAAIAPIAHQLKTLKNAQHNAYQSFEQQVAALKQAQDQAIEQATTPLVTQETLHTFAEALQTLTQQHEHTAAQLNHYIEEFERTQHQLLVQPELHEPQPHAMVEREIVEAEHELETWQGQDSGIIAKMAQFDTICEQFQRLEAAVLQIQQSLQNLTHSQPVSNRRSNTVYTRY